MALLALIVPFTLFRASLGKGSGDLQSRPPAAPVRPVVDEYYGNKVTDPYRYMENLTDPQVDAWFKSQNAYTRGVLESIPGRAGLLGRIKQLDESAPARVIDVRRLPSGQYFYQKRLASEDLFKIYMREGLSGQEKLLVDPTSFAKPGSPHFAINYYAPSMDGRYVAFGISPAGSEDAVIHVVDTTTGKETGDVVDRAQFGPPSWLPDGQSFVYNRLQKLGPNSAPTDRYLKSRVYLHVLRTDPEKDIALFGSDMSAAVQMKPEDIPFVGIVPGSPYSLGVIAHGVQNEVTIYSASLDSLRSPDIPWKKICDVDDDVTGFDVHGSDLYLQTHKGSSRFKVLHTTLSSPDLATAEVLVPASESVIRTVAAAADALYVQELDGGIGRLVRVPYGGQPEQVVLPIDGTVTLSATDQRMPGTLLELTSWTKANAIYAYDPGSRQITDTKLQPIGPYDAPQDLESVEVKARSYDGTLVPLSITYKKGLKLDGSNPTLLRGYGAYGITQDPGLDPKYLAWYELGGVFAVAHIRGGGEYGEDWHLAGKGITKHPGISSPAAST
jgi:prolyl oligopeptidase